MRILQEGKCIYRMKKTSYSVGVKKNVIVLRIGKENFHFSSEKGVENSLWVAEVFFNIHTKEVPMKA